MRASLLSNSSQTTSSAFYVANLFNIIMQESLCQIAAEIMALKNQFEKLLNEIKLYSNLKFILVS